MGMFTRTLTAAPFGTLCAEGQSKVWDFLTPRFMEVPADDFLGEQQGAYAIPWEQDQLVHIDVISGDDNGLLWLTLGFISPDPLDVLHIACGESATSVMEEDVLYLERNDQDLACSGQVMKLVACDDHIALSLTPEGASSLGLPAQTHFSFRQHPALFAAGAAQMARMAASGQTCIKVQNHVV
jgi:hypothetical protein